LTENQDGNSFADIVEGWQARLLQLNGRNSLLNFKPGGTTALIADHTPDEIALRLDSSRNDLKFDYAEPKSGHCRTNRFEVPDERTKARDLENNRWFSSPYHLIPYLDGLSSHMQDLEYYYF